jgi:hypothetical protein
MSVSDRFRKLFSSQRPSGGGQLTAEAGFIDAEQVVESELSEYEKPEPAE